MVVFHHLLQCKKQESGLVKAGQDSRCKDGLPSNMGQQPAGREPKSFGEKEYLTVIQSEFV